MFANSRQMVAHPTSTSTYWTRWSLPPLRFIAFIAAFKIAGHRGLVQPEAPQEHKVQELHLVNFAEVHFLRVVLNEIQDVFFAEAVSLVAIPIMPFGSRVVAEQAVGNPFLNFVMVFAQTFLKVAHRVPFGDSARVTKGFNLHHDSGLRAFQALGDGGRRNFSGQLIECV